MNDPLRHHRHLGEDLDQRFGPAAESFARFFGTVEYLLVQTVLVAIWITLNCVGLVDHWDTYPFILLNLIFSTQAAYAAPLILLAQNRQADRDKAQMIADAHHREDIAAQHGRLLELNTHLTEQIHQLLAAREVRS